MDPEIDAMSQIAKALTPLDTDAVRRVLKWAIERYQSRTSTLTTSGPAEAATVAASGAAPAMTRSFLNLPELFDAAAPDAGLDRVLVAGYWFQVLASNGEDWDSQSVNTELKQLGHPSTNITRDMDNLMARTPKYVMQTRKEGTTKQARKKYKLTREGIRAVELMLSRSAPLAER